MKETEVSDKIYLDILPNEDSVKYLRTDVFIEKAWDWIEDNLLSSNQ